MIIARAVCAYAAGKRLTSASLARSVPTFTPSRTPTRLVWSARVRVLFSVGKSFTTVFSLSFLHRLQHGVRRTNTLTHSPSYFGEAMPTTLNPVELLALAQMVRLADCNDDQALPPESSAMVDFTVNVKGEVVRGSSSTRAGTNFATSRRACTARWPAP